MLIFSMKYLTDSEFYVLYFSSFRFIWNLYL